MNYENLPCPACGAHFHEGDDIVVCPLCGTPQHRACWAENGNCVNNERHGEGFRWARAEKSDPVNDDTLVFTLPPEALTPQTKICSVCGSENPADISHCGHCGASLDSESEEATTVCIYCGSENARENSHCKNCGAPLTPYVRARQNPYIAATGLDENEIIGHHTAGVLAMYVRNSAGKYLRKFKAIEEGKVSFNWAAFFFGYIWMFSRKVYKYGLIVILLLATAVLVASAMPGTQRANEIIAPFAEQYYNGNFNAAEFAAVAPEFYNAMKIPSLIMGLTLLALNLFCGFAGDRLYYKKVRTDLDEFANTVPDRDLQAMLIRRRGGMSVLSGICGYFIYTFAVSILSRVAQFIASKM